MPDAWIDHDKTQIGYEISFTRHFYKPTPLRTLDEIKADLAALQEEAEGLLDQIVAPTGGHAMTGDLSPYPEYKDSGLSWLGQVPAHWETRRAKYLYREVDERSKSGAEVLCSVSHKTGVTPRKDNVTMFMAESTVGYKICAPERPGHQHALGMDGCSWYLPSKSVLSAQRMASIAPCPIRLFFQLLPTGYFAFLSTNESTLLGLPA